MLGADAISSAGGYSVPFAWERVDHRPDIPLVPPEFSPSRPTGNATLLSNARALFTLVVGYQTNLVASLIINATLLSLLVGGT